MLSPGPARLLRYFEGRAELSDLGDLSFLRVNASGHSGDCVDSEVSLVRSFFFAYSPGHHVEQALEGKIVLLVKDYFSLRLEVHFVGSIQLLREDG